MIGAALFFGYLFLWVGGGIAVLLLGYFYYDKRYRRNESNPDDRPPHGFHPTSEVFIDPKDGFKYRVYYNPYKGEREYVREP